MSHGSLSWFVPHEETDVSPESFEIHVVAYSDTRRHVVGDLRNRGRHSLFQETPTGEDFPKVHFRMLCLRESIHGRVMEFALFRQISKKGLKIVYANFIQNLLEWRI